jgi:hypothetical protein
MRNADEKQVEFKKKQVKSDGKRRNKKRNYDPYHTLVSTLSCANPN